MDAAARSGKFEELDKGNLSDLADALLLCGRETIRRCVEFICADTKGIRHGRARAMMDSQFKHCVIAPEQRRQLVDCITSRLASGDFSEQFRLALHLDPERSFDVARLYLSGASKGHIRRLAQWVVNDQQSA